MSFVEFDDITLRVCDNTLVRHGMIAPNRAIIFAIAFRHIFLTDSLLCDYNHASGDSTLSDEDALMLLDAVSFHYLSEPWPCDLKSQPDPDFMNRLIEKASWGEWVFLD